MANADAPFGFRLIEGADSRYRLVQAVIPASDSTATFVGDAVKLLAAGSGEAYPAVIQAAAGDPVYGVVESFRADPATSLEDQYRKASTKRYVTVALADDGAEFEIQSDDDTTALAIADVGLNASFVVGSGSTVTGLSGMELDSSSAATTSTLDLQIMRLVDRDDNDISTDGTNKNVVVRFNDPQTKHGRTGV